jgi:hypothetical protein
MLKNSINNRKNEQYINPYKMWIGSFIPNWLLQRVELSPGAKLCYARLCQFARKADGVAYPGQKTLATELGISGRQVRRYLKELEKCNLIAIEQIGRTCSNRYRFFRHSWQECGTYMSSHKESEQSLMTTHSGSDRTEMSVHDRTHRTTPIEREPLEKNHKREERADRSLEHLDINGILSNKQFTLFERFWSVYPKKVGKKKTKEVWKRIRPAPTPELVEVMVSTINAWIKSDQWVKDGGQFIPHPTTWLNAGRWEDDAPSGPAIHGVTDIMSPSKADHEKLLDEVLLGEESEALKQGINVTELRDRKVEKVKAQRQAIGI